MITTNGKPAADRPRAALFALWKTWALSLAVIVVMAMSAFLFLGQFPYGDEPATSIERALMRNFPFSFVGDGSLEPPRRYIDAPLSWMLNILEWTVLSIVFVLLARRRSTPAMFAWALVYLLLVHALTSGILAMFDLALIPDQVKM